MKILNISLTLLLLFSFANAADFGIYEKVIENAAGTPEQVAAKIADVIEASDITLLNKLPLHTPNLVRKDTQKHTTFTAFLVIATSSSFDSLLAGFGNRYAANWILRVGIYQDENGTQVQIANPETITRIICNDLPEKDYQTVIDGAKEVKQNLRKIIISVVEGKEVAIQMPPIRSDERIRKAKKDMMMMVGPMTFFKKGKQFPILREEPVGENANATFKKVLAEVEQNINNFKPSKGDIDYTWTTDPQKDLLWQVAAKVEFPGINAAMIGIMRARTEALSFHICGMKREKDSNLTPGIDHVTAYPIEVVVFEEDNKIKVGTPKEMFRMDMFFWDAGKMAFMKYMNMPKTLDKSIKKAVTGIAK